MELTMFRGKHIMRVKILLLEGCAINLTFLDVWKNPKVYPKMKISMKSDFPRILKLQKTEHEIRVVTKYVISKCNILFQIFVQKDFESRSKSFRLT